VNQNSSQNEDVERWRRIEDMYGAALSCAPAERAAFLDACCSDSDLRLEVDSLLRANDEAGHFLTSMQLATHIRELSADLGPALGGRKLGPYTILSAIGSGATGDIYRASDARLGREVALKVLQSRFTHDPASLSRFVREARAASALNHPNIITVHEIADVDGTHFIATEFIEGVSLRERLAAGRLELDEALDVAIQCASALTAGHRANIVHRDIKPENIMLRPDGLVKVVDFGLARMDVEAEGEPSGGRTIPGVIMGTPRYMSPEQARGRPLDSRTDIFSLGAVLYEMVVGRPRFAGESTAEVFASLLSVAADSEEPALEHLPPDVKPILRKALEKDRDRRYQTIDAFGHDLRELRQRLNPKRDSEHAGRSLVRARPVTVSVLACGAAALVAAGWFVLRPAGPSLQPLLPVPLTSDRGYELEPRLSPDGTRVAYTRGRRESTPEVVVQEVENARSAPHVVGRQAFSAVWSPQGDRLALLVNQAEDSTHRDVILVSVPSGTSRKIAEVDTPGPFQPFLPSTYLDFSPDGRFLVASDGWGVDSQSHLVLISAETGDKVALTSPGASTLGDFSPRFSYDGKRVAFARLRRLAAADLYVLDLTSEMRPAGLSTKIASNDLWNAFPVWTRDNRHLVFAGGQFGSARMKLVRVSGTYRTDLQLNEAGVSALDLRPAKGSSASRVVYTRFTRDSDIFRVGIDGGESREIGPGGTPLIDSSLLDELPQYSADGSAIAFVSNRTGSTQVWIARADGSEPRQLTRLQSADVRIQSVAWSPDGARLAVVVTRPDGAGIFEVLASNGGMRLLVDGEADMPLYSADGRWLYFRVPDRRTPKTSRIPATGGQPELVKELPPGVLGFTPDGKAVVYAKGLAVFMQTLGGGRPLLLFPSIRSERSVAVAASAVYAITRSASGDWGLARRRFADQKAVPVTAYAREVGDGIAISPDERYALLTQQEHEVLDLMLLDDVDLLRR
jgi:eukaryotic-like serine/threonine-protein kinase